MIGQVKETKTYQNQVNDPVSKDVQPGLQHGLTVPLSTVTEFVLRDCVSPHQPVASVSKRQLAFHPVRGQKILCFI